MPKNSKLITFSIRFFYLEILIIGGTLLSALYDSSFGFFGLVFVYPPLILLSLILTFISRLLMEKEDPRRGSLLKMLLINLAFLIIEIVLLIYLLNDPIDLPMM